MVRRGTRGYTPSLSVFPDSSYRTAAIIILRLSVILWDLEIQPEIPLSSCGMIPDLFTGVSCNRYYAPCRRYSLSSLVFPPSIHFLPWHREFGGKYWSRSNAVGIEIWPIETRDFAISFEILLVLFPHLLPRRSNRREN